jgi:uncharacterized membrane protein
MPTVAPETSISLIYIAAGGLFVLLGMPLYLRWVPPNRFYGFRTARTLVDPSVWYAVNRVSGGWLTILGAVTAGVATAVERLNLSLSAAATINCVVVVTGMALILVHSLRTLWRVK